MKILALSESIKEFAVPVSSQTKSNHEREKSEKNSKSYIENGVLINSNCSVRLDDDKFGRKMTDLRRSLTKDDTLPFPRIE